MIYRWLAGLISILTILLAVWSPIRSAQFELYFLDVGQGDAILVRTPENITMLIDGGPGDQVLAAISNALGPLQNKIDIIVLTHPDADHYEGLISVLEQYNVQAVLLTGADNETAGFAQFKSLAANLSVKVSRGDLVRLGDQVEFVIVWPPQDQGAQAESNDTSVVGQLKYNNFNFLLTGDIGSSVEAELGRQIKTEYLRSQVLKPAHHGSKNSSSDQFIKLVAPQLAVISAGRDNKYGHPADEVLKRLESLGAEILRTDQQGTIKFRGTPEKGVFLD